MEAHHRILYQVVNGYSEASLLDTVIHKVNPNFIVKDEIMTSGEVCYCPILLQAVIRRNLYAVKKLLAIGANPRAHYYVIDQDQNCVYAISARQMAHKISLRDYCVRAQDIYNILNSYCDDEE